MMRRSGLSNRTVLYRIGKIAMLAILGIEFAKSQQVRAESMQEEKSATIVWNNEKQSSKHLNGAHVPRRVQADEEALSETDKGTQNGWTKTLMGLWHAALSLADCFGTTSNSEVPTLMPSEPPSSQPRMYSNAKTIYPSSRPAAVPTHVPPLFQYPYQQPNQRHHKLNTCF
jgi:hypothetical protein